MRVLHFYKTYHPDSVGGVEQVIATEIVAIGFALGFWVIGLVSPENRSG